MSRGPSKRQREALALLVTEKRSLDVTAELLPALGLEPTDSSRRSMLRALRLLERRGLVTLERVPSGRGGWPRLLATARPGARGELTGAELQRSTRGKGTQTKAPKATRRRRPGRQEPVCARCARPATHLVYGMRPKAHAGKPTTMYRSDPSYCAEHAEQHAAHINAGGCHDCDRKATHSVIRALTTAGVPSPHAVRREGAARCAEHARADVETRQREAREH